MFGTTTLIFAKAGSDRRSEDSANFIERAESVNATGDSLISMNMSYECWAYKNGKPDKMVHVVANNKSEAKALAWEKFRDLGIKPERVTCK